MKKALIVAAVLNLLLCSGMQALSASGWTLAELAGRPVYEYKDANGTNYYVDPTGEGNIDARDLVFGFELPVGSYKVDSKGQLIALPTILATDHLEDGSLNPDKWVPTGTGYTIVSDPSGMVNPQVGYIYRMGNETTAPVYLYREPFGDHDVPVYSQLPEATTEGAVVAVNGRKYQAVMKSVLGEHYTNVVDSANVIVNKRYNSKRELVDAPGYVAISDIKIPDEIAARARAGEKILVRMSGISLETSLGFGGGTVHFYKGDARQEKAHASQIMTYKDYADGSKYDVTYFYLYWTTDAVKVESANAYNKTVCDADTLFIGAGVSSKALPASFDPSSVIITFDEIIGETYEDKLVWEYIGDYETPMPAGFYKSSREVTIADDKSQMTDANKTYIFGQDGNEYYYANYMNALLKLPDGTVRYYVDGVPQHAGVVKDFYDNYYYINHTKQAVTACSYTISDARCNNLLPAGTYEFDQYGRCITLPVVIDNSDPHDIQNGLVKTPDGNVRYLVDGVPQHQGVVKDQAGHYYYINHTTYPVKSCDYTFVTYKGNNLLPGCTYSFDANGWCTTLPQVIDNSDPADIQNGLVKMPDGSVQFLIDGIPQHAGLVQDSKGNTYYINHRKTAVRDVCYPISKTNGLMDPGKVSFDEYGYVMDLTVPSYWQNELQATIDTVNKQKAEIGEGAISFVAVADMHVDIRQRLFCSKWIGTLAANIMNTCDVPMMMVLGDTNTRAAHDADDADHLYADILMADEFLSPVGWNRISRILGNHDGAWGVNPYYGKCLDLQGKNDLIYSRQQKAYEAYYNIATDVHYDEKDDSATWYYVDDEATKVRYINLNSHWAEYTVDENFKPTYDPFRGYHYGQKQLEWLATEALDMEEGWTAAVFSHVPPDERSGPIVNGGSANQWLAQDQYILLGILNAYARGLSYTDSYNSSHDWADVKISVDYSASSATAAKGEICGVFSGHIHDDHIDSRNWPFPVISILASGASPEKNGYTYTNARLNAAGTDMETSFDVVVVDPVNKIVYLNRVGDGMDRVAYYGLNNNQPLSELE